MTGATEALIDDLVERLSDPANANRAAALPHHTREADQPGLYAWWADDEGMEVLSLRFDVELPSLIYAGQAGATSRRSRTTRAATLRTRIGGNHLNGNIRSSTFRRTLTAVLFEPLQLRLAAPDRLDAASNSKVSTWMRERLRVAIAPVEERAALAHIEEAVLQRLNPPLNLMGMEPTSTRNQLRQLRAALRVPSPTVDECAN